MSLDPDMMDDADGERCPVMDFGPYRGQRLDDLPTSHIVWLLTKAKYCPRAFRPWLRGALIMRNYPLDDLKDRG